MTAPHGASTEVGRLRTVMLHRPGPELKRLVAVLIRHSDEEHEAEQKEHCEKCASGGAYPPPVEPDVFPARCHDVTLVI